MADPWAAFPDAPPVAGRRHAASTADAWSDFPDAPPQGDALRSGARVTGQFAQNTNDALASAAGFPVDLAAKGLRAIGVPVGPAPFGGSESLKSGIDYVATLPGRVTDAVSQGSISPLTDPRTSRFEPETKGERVAAGIGQYTGNTLATLLPATAISRFGAVATATPAALRTGGQTATVALAPYVAPLAAQPGSQLAAAMAGGAVEGATNNPVAGLGAALLTPTLQAGAMRAVTPVANRLAAQEQRLVDAAGREGIPLTAAQRTGSPTLRLLEETMAILPGSSGVMQGVSQGQRQAFNRAAMSRTGTQADDVSPDTLANAYRNIGQTFDDLAARTTVNVDSRFADDIERIASDYGRRLSTDQAPVFSSYMDDLAPLLQAARTPNANPQLAGEIYQRIRSGIGETARTTNDLQLKRALTGITSALDDVMERSAGGALRQEWQEARRQYQALSTIDSAAGRGTQVDRSSSDLPLGALSNAVRASDKAGYGRGRGQLNELSRVGDFLAPRIPNSGTPSRSKMAELLTGSSLPGVGVAAAGGFTPEAFAAGTAVTAAAAGLPYAVSRAYTSPAIQRYLTNQLVTPPNLAQLMAMQAVREGVAGASGNERISERNQRLARALLAANEARDRR